MRALRRWAKRWSPRRWAVEGASGLGRILAQQLATDGEHVVDVPAKLAAPVAVALDDLEGDAAALPGPVQEYAAVAAIDPAVLQPGNRRRSSRRSSWAAPSRSPTSAAVT